MHLMMHIVRRQLRFETVEIYVERVLLCQTDLNVKFSEIIIFRINPVTSYFS